MNKKPAALGASIIATKGSALPSVQTQAVTTKSVTSVDSEHRTAVTVRLDEERYKKLKMFGIDRRLSNQDIFVAALDAYLK